MMDANTIADGILIAVARICLLIGIMGGIYIAITTVAFHARERRERRQRAARMLANDPAHVAKQEAAFRSFMGMN